MIACSAFFVEGNEVVEQAKINWMRSVGWGGVGCLFVLKKNQLRLFWSWKMNNILLSNHTVVLVLIQEHIGSFVQQGEIVSI